MSVPGQNKLPQQTPNSSSPIAIITDLDPMGLEDSTGKAITGKIAAVFAYVTPAWRYLFGTFAVTTSAIDPNFTLTAGGAYSQAQMQKLADQVALLSKQLGRTT